MHPSDPRTAPSSYSAFGVDGRTDAPPSEAARLIDSVFRGDHGDEPSVSPAVRKTRGLRPGRVAALASTVVGKIVLCGAVAAASVGGVYATTDRISLTPTTEYQPIETQIDVSMTAPPPPAAAPTQTAVTLVVTEPETVPVELVDESPTEELEGCERGQATAEAASSNGGNDTARPGVDRSPCDGPGNDDTPAADHRPANPSDESNQPEPGQGGPPQGGPAAPAPGGGNGNGNGN